MICIISFFMLVYTLDRGIIMGTKKDKKYINEVGKRALLWSTPMGNKIYLLNNGQKYKKFCLDYGDLRSKVNKNFKDRLLEQTEEYGHSVICFPETIITNDKWLSGMVTDFVTGEKLKNIDLNTQIDYLLYLIEKLEESIVDVSFKGWVLEDLHEENILINKSDYNNPVKIIDTDFYLKNKTNNQKELLQNYKNNLERIFDAVMITILPQFDISFMWNDCEIQQAYLKATQGEIKCSQFLKLLLKKLKLTLKKEQNILTLRKTVNQL